MDKYDVPSVSQYDHSSAKRPTEVIINRTTEIKILWSEFELL